MPGQSGKQVLELSQFDLRLGRGGAGIASKYVQDKRRPVEQLTSYLLLDVAHLYVAQVIIKDHQIRLVALHPRRHLLNLPLSDEGGYVDTLDGRNDDIHDIRAGRVGQQR